MFEKNEQMLDSKIEKKTRSYINWNEDKIKAILVALATEEDVLSWSRGEVKKADTINYKTFKAERHGLFDEVIFGPTVDYRCSVCGRRYNIINAGEMCTNTIKCRESNSEILPKSSRRRRMGHIKLHSPVVHFWYFKIDNSILSKLLGLKVEGTERIVTKNMIESVIYYKSHIVVESGGLRSLPKNLVIDISEAASIYHEALHEILSKSKGQQVDIIKEAIADLEVNATSKNGRSYGIDFYEINEIIHNYSEAKIMTGARAIEYLLEQVDLEKERAKVEAEILRINSQELTKNKISILKNAEREKLYKRLRVINSFINSGQHPRSLMIRALPVIPADLRPMIQLEGGRHSTSDVNELYRRVIIRNNRLKRWIEAEAPNLILQNELRMLQEAVDALIDNQRKHTNSAIVTAKDGRAFKSISDALVGKKGRFRQNLLGKRVDYSGRSVIVVGPELQMHQCGLPREMAAKLFEPWIIRGLVNSGATNTIKAAKKLIDDFHPIIWPVAEEVIKDKVVLLNRAPSLHRLSIQAFEPKLVRGRAIHLHPLVTAAFNADFDGDQMAVHVPLSDEAILEARELMLANKNILGPKDGEPIINPSQDMILGIYWLTQEMPNAKGEGRIFFSMEHLHRSLESGGVNIHARVAMPLKALKDTKETGYICSSVGKFIFNSVLPKSFPFIYNSSLDLSLKEYIEYSNKEFLATKAADIPKIIKEKVQGAFNKNAVARIIRYVFNEYNFEVPKNVIATVINNLEFNTVNEFEEEFKELQNPKDLFGGKVKSTHVDILVQATRKALERLKKMRNLEGNFASISASEKVAILEEVWFSYTNYIANILDQIKELGFKYSTKSGISVAISDVQQIAEKDEIVKQADKYIQVLRLKFEEGEITDDERYLLTIRKWTEVKDEVQRLVSDFVSGASNNPIVMMIRSGARGNISNFVQLSGIRGLMTNNVQTLKADAENERIVRSIVEVPIKSSFIQGLTAYEFFSSTHGARKGLTDVALYTAKSGYLTRRLVDVAQSIIVKEEDCDSDYGFWVRDIIDNKTQQVIIPLSERIEGRYSNRPIWHNGKMIVDRNELIDYEIAQQIIKAGIEVVQIRSVLSCHTKNSVCRMCYGKDLATNKLVEIGEAVGIIAAQSIGEPGTQLTMRNFHTGGVAGVSDITGGFTRLIELIDAYEKPWGTPAEISPIKGKVIDIEVKKRESEASSLEDYLITLMEYKTNQELKIFARSARKPRVSVGDEVTVGQKLTEGPINLQQLLRVADARHLQHYMLKEIQRLYRMQGIGISDKYVEIIIRQLLSKLVISSPGDSKFHAGAIVDAFDYQEENARLMLEGKKLAYGRVIIKGAKHVPLLSSSFLAAASYQETAKILVYAAIANQVDNLEGLKENIIIGHKIPAGTNLNYHADAHSKFDIKIPEMFFSNHSNAPLLDFEDLDFSEDLWAR